MNGSRLRRPKTVREVAEEADSYRQFGMNLKDFLHEFAYAKKQGRPLAPLLAEEPPRIAPLFAEGNICDAFIAATTDYLSRVNGLVTPEWALSADRVLDQPWFSLEFPGGRLRLLRDSPSAFKDKNIFTLDSSLNVA
jgi:hypothetical protein